MGKDADGETADELRGSKVPFEACDGGEDVLPEGGKVALEVSAS